MDVWWLVKQFNQGCTDWLTGGKTCVEGGWATKMLLQSARRTDVAKYRMSMRKSPDLCKAGVSGSEDLHRHTWCRSVLPCWAPGFFRKPKGRCHERLMPFCLHLRERNNWSQEPGLMLTTPLLPCSDFTVLLSETFCLPASIQAYALISCVPWISSVWLTVSTAFSCCVGLCASFLYFSCFFNSLFIFYHARKICQ